MRSSHTAADQRFTSDELLVAGLQSHDREAFECAVNRFSGAMLAAARSIVGDLAEDAVQDAWLKAFQSIKDFEGRSALSTWLTRIAVNSAISIGRKTTREQPLATNQSESDAMDWFATDGHWASPPTMWHSGSPEEILNAASLQECIEKYIALMPGNQRDVLVLRDMHSLEFDEICNKLSLTASNVRVLLHRGRIRLMGVVNTFEETGTC